MRTFLLVALLAATAAAQDSAPSGGVSLGLRAVYYVPADGESGAWGPGAQIRYDVNQRFGLEGSVDYQRHLFPDTTVHTAAGQASALVYFPFARARAFALGGLGYYVSRVHGPSYRRNLGRLGGHAGAGIEVPLNESWSIDATYRHVWLKDLESRDPSTLNLRTYKRSGEQLTFGVNRRF